MSGGVAVFDFPMTFRSITLNDHRTVAGAVDQTKLAECYEVDRFDPSEIQLRDQREPLHLRSGGDLGDASKTFRYVRVGGSIRSATQAGLDDKVSALLQTFDIDECQAANPATEGISAFAFYSPTGSPPSGFTSPVQEKFLARPAGIPSIAQRRSSGLVLPFSIVLVCADPRRYLATATTVTLNAGNGFSAACPNWTSLMGMAVDPLVTITMAGAGSATFTLTINGVALILNLSGLAAANIVTVDVATGTIKVGSTHRADLRTSAVTTFPQIPRGGATATATNTANVTSVVVSYNQARG